MLKLFSKKEINVNKSSNETPDMSQIIETAKSIINQAERNKTYGDYSERNGRHPIYGYINFLVRKFVYDIAYNDISKHKRENEPLMSFDTSDLDKWFRGLGFNEKDPGLVFGKQDVYLNFATDPLFSSYNWRDRVVNSYSGLGYNVNGKVSPNHWTNVVLMIPFGVGLALDDGCHSALSLSCRGEYKARVNKIYDFSEVVGEWNYQDGLLIKSSSNEKKEKKDVFPECLFQITLILFSIGKVMVEHGIEWREYTNPDDNCRF